MAKKKEMPYSVNFVEGFNPYEFIEDALDKDGQPIIQNNGEKLRYISTDAKKLWFMLKCPDGRIEVQKKEELNPRSVRYAASIYANGEDVYPKAMAEYQLTCGDKEDFDQMAAKVQTIAIGKALTNAGFGIEIEVALKLSAEGEKPTANNEDFVLSKNKSKKTSKDEGKQDLDPDILAMM